MSASPFLLSPISAFDVVGIAASAGGIPALEAVLNGLAGDFPAAIVVVQHLGARSNLHHVLQRHCPLPVQFVQHGEPVRPGTVYIAPPNSHATIDSGRNFVLTSDVPLNFVRPSADPLLISLAFQYGPRAIALILSGANRDGAVGAWAVKYAGGMVLVQDRDSSQYFAMPEAAINAGASDFMLPLLKISQALTALVCTPGVADFFRPVPQ